MPHGFDTYRVFISAPGDLEADRQVCCDAIAKVNESLAMPAKILLVSLGLRDNDQISGSRSIVSDNVRWSSYFIQLFQDDWGPRDLFRKIFLLATECRNNAEMPMSEIVVCLKDAPHESNPEILAFRQELEKIEDIRVFRYAQIEELKSKLEEVCGRWAHSLIEAAIQPGANTQNQPASS